MHCTSNQNLKYLHLIWLAVLFLLSACASTKHSSFRKNIREGVFQNSFHGLMVVDANTGKELFNINGDRYFTPASNTKIATLYAGLKMIPDHFPALKYIEKGDSVTILPTGDPSWVHPYFKDSTGIHFLKNKKHVSVYLQNFEDGRFGPGWAWEDYPYYFSTERSPLPLHGNVVSISNIDGLETSPHYFMDKVEIKNAPLVREEFKNEFYLDPSRQDTIQIPFITGKTLTKNLLEDILQKDIALLDNLSEQPTKILYGIPSDSIYKRMMHISDNFLAEQILVTASSTLSDTLSVKRTVDHMLKNELSFLDEAPRWVDGSGLSRYNLFSPKSLVQILQKMFQEVKQERLFAIFPNWDASGTISKWKNPENPPFIFAKTGSLGNNYNLSGYLKTKSGKILVFSFMNNHFRVPSSEIRSKIYAQLKMFHENY